MIAGPFTLEVQHRIHDVLEGLGAGNSPTLRDMPDNDHGGARRLGEAHESCGTLPHLTHVSRRPLQLVGGHRLNGIDHENRRVRRAGGFENRFERRFAENLHVVGLAQSLGSQLDLQRRLLSRDVEHARAFRRKRRRHLQQEG